MSSIDIELILSETDTKMISLSYETRWFGHNDELCQNALGIREVKCCQTCDSSCRNKIQVNLSNTILNLGKLKSELPGI